jgi:ABC-2 type transport system ATP-binding protein
MDPRVAKGEAYKWLKRFELLEHRDRRVEELSKGNQQKVQIVISVIHNPVLVVLDEPFAGLDPVNQDVFKDVLLELKQREKAIIYSTHQMDQAEKLSDTLCLINRGRVVLSGSVRDVKRRYGTSTVLVEFDGNGAFVESLPGVRKAIMYGNSAELELQEGTTAQSLLPFLIDRVELRKFELLEPSLHSIFIHVVEAGGEHGLPQRAGARA